MRYVVQEREHSHYVLGLKSSWASSDPEKVPPDTMLIYRYRHGDVDTRMRDADMMLGALYDLFQVEDALHDGDIFETEYGEFICRGVHVMAMREIA